MPRTTSEVTNANFSKGFITESGPLGFPQNSAQELDNLTLLKNGGVRVRNGLVPEDVGTILNVSENATTSVHEWNNVGDENRDFLVVQVDLQLYILSLDTANIGDEIYIAEFRRDGGSVITNDLSDLRPDFDFSSIGKTELELFSVASDQYLYLTSPATGPFYIWWLPEGTAGEPVVFNNQPQSSDPSIQIIPVSLEIRDFELLPTGWPYGEEFPLTATGYETRVNLLQGIHIYEFASSFTAADRFAQTLINYTYNLLNAGWTEEQIREFAGSKENYPALSYPATAGQQYSFAGNPQGGVISRYRFDLTAYEQSFGNTPSIRGHFKLRFPELDRQAAVGDDITILDSGLAIGNGGNVNPLSASSIEFFGQRAWYAGFGEGQNSYILFSQLLNYNYSLITNLSTGVLEDSFSGQCLQRQDPTAVDFNDLLDTDGGVVRIPDAVNIKALKTFKNTLLIFADNGVWSVSGTVDGFSANNYNVNKVTDASVLSKNSIITTEFGIMFWSSGEIYFLSSENVGQTGAQTITSTTIKSFYVNIPQSSKEKVQAAYYPKEQKVYWTYPLQDSEEELMQTLIYDLDLEGFSKYTFSPNTLSYDQCFLQDESPVESSFFNTAIIDKGIAYYVGEQGQLVIFNLFQNEMIAALNFQNDSNIGDASCLGMFLYGNTLYLSTASRQIIEINLNSNNYSVTSLATYPNSGSEGPGCFVYDKTLESVRWTTVKTSGTDWEYIIYNVSTGAIVKNSTLAKIALFDSYIIDESITSAKSSVIQYTDELTNEFSLITYLDPPTDNGDGTYTHDFSQALFIFNDDELDVKYGVFAPEITNEKSQNPFSDSSILLTDAVQRSFLLLYKDLYNQKVDVFNIDIELPITKLDSAPIDPVKLPTVQTILDSSQPRYSTIGMGLTKETSGVTNYTFDTSAGEIGSTVCSNDNLFGSDSHLFYYQNSEIYTYYPVLSSYIGKKRNNITHQQIYNLPETPQTNFTDHIIRQRTSQTSSEEDILVGSEQVVVDTNLAGTQSVTIISTTAESTEEKLLYLLTFNNLLQFYAFDEEGSGNYVDYAPKEIWEAANQSTIPYINASLQAGAEFLDNLTREKQAVYVYSYFDSTEDTVYALENSVTDTGNNNIEVGFSDARDFLNESGCTLRVGFDWSNIGRDVDVTKKQKAYRRGKVEVPSYPTPANESFSLNPLLVFGGQAGYRYSLFQDFEAYPYKSVSVSRLKARGKGKSLNLVYENSEGKGFTLLGFAYPMVANGNV